MSSEDYVLMQLRLECIGISRVGRLTRIPGPEPDDLGRLYVYRLLDGYRVYGRDDLSDGVYAALQDLGAEAAFTDAAAVQAILARDAPCGDVARWRTYRLNLPDPAIWSGAIVLTEVYRPSMDAYHPGMLLGERPIYAVVGKNAEGLDAIYATCVSVRENDEAAECYVYTHSAWRQRGYGRRVTAAWAAAVLALGKVPFYSYLTANVASSRLLQSLPASFCFEGVVYG